MWGAIRGKDKNHSEGQETPDLARRRAIARIARDGGTIAGLLAAPALFAGTAKAESSQQDGLGGTAEILSDMEGAIPLEAVKNNEESHYVEISYPEIERILLARYPHAREHEMQRTLHAVVEALAVDSKWSATFQLNEHEIQEVRKLDLQSTFFIRYADNPMHVYASKLLTGKWWGDVPGVLIGKHKIQSIFIDVKALWRLLDAHNRTKK